MSGREDDVTGEPAEGPASRPSDDEVWAGLVAAYSAPAADRTRTGADGADAETTEATGDDAADGATADPTADGARTDGATADDAPRTPVDDPSPGSGWRTATGFEDIEAELAGRVPGEDAADADPLGEEHEHYVPPEPPPIPEGDPVTRAAWAGVIGGPLFIVLATLLGWGPGGLPGLCAVLAFVGGFITLVTRMSDDRPDDDEDDGAVV